LIGQERKLFVLSLFFKKLESEKFTVAEHSQANDLAIE
jgi:hypothetical protein